MGVGHFRRDFLYLREHIHINHRGNLWIRCLSFIFFGNITQFFNQNREIHLLSLAIHRVGTETQHLHSSDLCKRRVQGQRSGESTRVRLSYSFFSLSILQLSLKTGKQEAFEQQDMLVDYFSTANRNLPF